MDTLEAIRTKLAVREFTDQPVSEETIKLILEAGRRAQSSKNSQPWHFVVVRDRQTLRQLSECGQYAGHLAGAAFGVALVTSATGDFDIGQTASYLQLAAWDLGIGSCIASMWEPEKARAILGIPDDQRFEQALSFGYPAQPRQASGKGRMPLADLVRWERW